MITALNVSWKKTKIKWPNDYIKYDLFPKTYKNHSKVYTFYDDESHLLFCEYCIIPGSSKKITELQENCRDNLLILEIIKCNYSSFEEIQGDFRILYGAYKYLNFELNVKKKRLKIKWKSFLQILKI